MTQDDGRDFNPDWTTAPGATLADWMAEHGTTVRGLASICSIAEPVYNPDRAEAMLAEVLSGQPLTAAHALLISAGTGTQVGFWMDRETRYRQDLDEGRTDTTGDLWARVPGGRP